MTNLTTYPLQDGFETSLAQSWNGATGTVFLNTAPSFTFPSGVKTYIVVNPGKTNMQVGRIDSMNVGNKTVNVDSVTIEKGAGLNYTAQIHAVGSKVIISDNYQFWKDIATSINSKMNTNDSTDILANKYADATARDADLTSPVNGNTAYLTSEGYWTDYIGGVWVERATGAVSNASATVAGKVEIATSAQSIAGTDTGETGALMSVLPSDVAKNIQSGTFVYGADAGGDDTYVVALTPTLAAYTTGQHLQFKVTTTNTGACSVDFGPGVLNIKTKDGNDPQSGVIRANMIVSGYYDGTNFVLDTPDFSTDTNRGVVELATPSETVAGTSTTQAVTPAGLSNALVGGDYDRQWQINWFNDSSTSFINATASANYNLAAKQVDDCMNLDFTSDGYVYSVLRGKPGAANLNLRWDDVTRAELEFWLMTPTSIPSANRYVEVGFADTSATTGWTDFTSVQRRCFITGGNAVSTSYLMRTADGTTASSGGALTATITNWNKINIIYERGVSVKTYINDVLAETKTTNLPSGTNNIVVGAGVDSPASENMYLSAITVRVKYA